MGKMNKQNKLFLKRIGWFLASITFLMLAYQNCGGNGDGLNIGGNNNNNSTGTVDCVASTAPALCDINGTQKAVTITLRAGKNGDHTDSKDAMIPGYPACVPTALMNAGFNCIGNAWVFDNSPTAYCGFSGTCP